MRVREIIETALFAAISEATRINYVQIGNTQANVDKIVAILDTIPEELNLELSVVIQNHVNEEA
jgi:biotin synthase-like enzyme